MPKRKVKATTPSRLLDLPAELRTTIYSLVFGNPVICYHVRWFEWAPYDPSKHTTLPKRLSNYGKRYVKYVYRPYYDLDIHDYHPELSQTCKFIHEESRPVLHNVYVTLRICRGEGMVRDLDLVELMLQPRILPRVRKLVVHERLVRFKGLSSFPNLEAIVPDGASSRVRKSGPPKLGLDLKDKDLAKEADRLLEAWRECTYTKYLSDRGNWYKELVASVKSLPQQVSVHERVFDDDPTWIMIGYDRAHARFHATIDVLASEIIAVKKGGVNEGQSDRSTVCGGCVSFLKKRSEAALRR